MKPLSAKFGLVIEDSPKAENEKTRADLASTASSGPGAFPKIQCRGILGWLLTAACAFLLVACASIDAHTTQYVGVPHYGPTQPSSVAILRGEPIRPHERLGEILVDASTNPEPPITQIEDKLRSQAARIGADAVVIVVDRVQPVSAYVTGGWYSRSVQTVTGHRLVGVAIKYR